MELLSPAGDMESLKTAIRCGADAVYIGGPSFSARKNAKNFTEAEIKEAVDFCHLRLAKVYVAVNIVIKETELDDAISYAKRLMELGCDGVIVQDLGLLSAIRAMSGDIRLNASTQMTVCSTPGVKLLEELGVDRAVLARELSEEEIASIRKHTDMELETFVHGALCISWSGQCLMSSIIGGRSGNRGACAQPCRLPYVLYVDGKPVTKQAPLLCTKDLCLAKDMDRVSAISDSAKIEGRMKSPEYAGIVTKVYKKALCNAATDAEISDMLSFFSRGGSCKGYFGGRLFGDMMDKGGAGKISASRESVTEIKNAEFEKKRKISFTLTAKVGSPLSLIASCDGFFAGAEGEALEPAKNGIFDNERMIQQLHKLGDTVFCPDETEILTEGTPFVPVSALNALRRQVCEDIETQICESFRRTVKEAPEQEKTTSRRKNPILCVQVRTKEQLAAVKASGADEIYVSEALSALCEDAVCALPSLTKEGEKLHHQAEKVLVQNIGQIKLSEGKVLYGGERLNVTNSRTARVLADLGFSRVTISPELNLREMKQLKTDVPTEVIAYGRLPVMLIENCIIKSHYQCVNGKGYVELSDRMGERFPVVCENCRNVIYNSVPLYMADKIEDVLSVNPDAIRLLFTTESGEETAEVIRAYKKALSGDVPGGVFDRITRGHFYRGVE